MTRQFPLAHDAADDDVVTAATAGDESAFAELVGRHRVELHRHCYRMLRSFDQAEDAVQETFLRAWRARGSFAGRSKFRTWLYTIATNACLDELSRPHRRARTTSLGTPGDADVAQRTPELPPDESSARPDDAVVAKEELEQAFLAAMALLPSRQRAVLILRDVLRWSAVETATLLGTSVASVNSALQRARATLDEHRPGHGPDWTPAAPLTVDERAMLNRYVDAIARADAAAIAELVREDSVVHVPVEPLWLDDVHTLVAA